MNCIKRFVGVALWWWLGGLPVSAQSEYNYTLEKGYLLTIQGGSNLHDWTETVGRADGTSAVNWLGSGSFDLNGLRLIVEVQSISSTEGGIMNHKTYSALKIGQCPTISFVLTRPLKAVAASRDGAAVEAVGALTIAGVTRQVLLHAKVTAAGDQRITFEGTLPLKMSDYAIDPPTALFGTLKVADQITLCYRATFSAGHP